MYVVEIPVQILVFNRIPLEENKGLKYPFGVEKFQQKYVDYLLWLSFIYILSHSSNFQTTMSNFFFLDRLLVNQFLFALFNL